MIPSTRLRLFISVVATGSARVALVLYGFFLVPILLSHWGISLYGEWVLLTALATMASLSNVGFVQAAASELVMRIAAGDKEEAASVFWTAIIALVGLMIGVLCSTGIALSFVSLKPIFGITLLSSFEVNAIIQLVFLSVILGFFFTPMTAGLGAVLGVGIPTSITTTVKCGEIAGVFAVVSLGGGPIEVASVLVVSAVTNLAILGTLLWCKLPWLCFFRPEFRAATFQRLLHPSLGTFLLFASVNIFAVQVPRIVLGHIAGATEVALFSIAVTYARATRSFTGIVGQSMQIELSRAYGEKDYFKMAKFLRLIFQFVFWLSIAGVTVQIIAAKHLYLLWTHGEAKPNLVLLTVLSASTVVGAYSDVSIYFLTGINHVWRIAISHVAATTIGIIFAIVAFPRFGLTGMAVGLFFPEIATAATGFIYSSGVLHQNQLKFFKDSISPPYRVIYFEVKKILTSCS